MCSAQDALAATQALERASIAYGQHRLPEALAAGREAAKGGRPEGWTIVGLVGCFLGDLALIGEAYKSATAGGKPQIEANCRARQIVLKDGAFVRSPER